MSRISGFRIVLYCMVGAGLVGLACAGVFVWRLLPSFEPLLAVSGEVAKAYPGSNPQVTVFWHNGQKTFRVAAAVQFDPSGDPGPEMAEGIAAIVREHYDLAGFAGIQVQLEQRRQVGIVQTKRGKTFHFPVRRPPLTDDEVQQFLEAMDAAEGQQTSPSPSSEPRP
jgi:hypothetical protein